MYQWFVFTHLVGLVIFLFAHGASAFTTYQIRGMRDPAIVSGYLQVSLIATRVAYIGLLLLLVGGAGAATSNGFWSQVWVFGSVIVLIVVIVTMPPISGEARAAYLDSRRPDILGAIGGLGLLVIVWPMVMKPS